MEVEIVTFVVKGSSQLTVTLDRQELLAVMFITAFTTNAMTSAFLSSIFPGWVVMFLDSHRFMFTFLIWLDLQGVALAFRISILKTFKLLLKWCIHLSWSLYLYSKLLTQGYRYHKLRKKTFGKYFRSYSDLLSKFCEISFKEYVSEGISHPVFYSDLVFKLRRVKSEANFVSSGSEIVYAFDVKSMTQ